MRTLKEKYAKYENLPETSMPIIRLKAEVDYIEDLLRRVHNKEADRENQYYPVKDCDPDGVWLSNFTELSREFHHLNDSMAAMQEFKYDTQDKIPLFEKRLANLEKRLSNDEELWGELR